MWVFTKTLSGRFHFFFAEKKVIIRRIFAENNTYNCRKVLSAEHKAAVVETPGGHVVDECEEVAAVIGEGIVGCGVFAADDEAVVLHCAQTLGEHLVAEAVNGGKNLLEMGVAAHDGRKHLDGPFAAQHIHRVAYCQYLATQLLLVFPFDKTNDCVGGSGQNVLRILCHIIDINGTG